MKSLLIKDYLFYKRHGFLISFFAYFLIPIVTSFNYDVSHWGLVFPCAFASLLVIETLNQDTRQNWNEFQECLPFKKSDIVSAKYVFALIASSFMILSGCGAAVMKHLMNVYLNYDFAPGEFFAPFVTNAVVIIGNGIIMYRYYRSGMSSTKTLSIGIFLVAVLGGVVVETSEAFVVTFDNILIKVLLVLAVAVAIYVWFWIKAIKVYEKNGVKI